MLRSTTRKLTARFRNQFWMIMPQQQRTIPANQVQDLNFSAMRVAIDKEITRASVVDNVETKRAKQSH
jgi:hypothetical protein